MATAVNVTNRSPERYLSAKCRASVEIASDLASPVSILKNLPGVALSATGILNGAVVLLELGLAMPDKGLQPIEIMFRRLGNLIRGFFGLFIKGLERKNPEALLEVEKENLREQIGKYNKSLAAHAGMCERLISQVRKLEEEEQELRAKTAAHLKAGNKKTAGQYALRLQTVAREHEENSKQLEAAEATYKELVAARDVSVKAARDKIASLERSLDETKMKSAMADLNEMAAGMIGEIGDSGDTLNRLQELIEEERDKAAGRARVAKDSIDTSEIQVKAAEQDALEEMALADFAAEMGMAIEDESDSSETKPASKTKTMGPEESESESA